MKMKKARRHIVFFIMLMMMLMGSMAVQAASIRISPASKTIQVGKSFTIKTTVSGRSGKVAWSSSNKKVAVVTNGKVTGRSVGTAVITAKANGKSAKCRVSVIKAAASDSSQTTTNRIPVYSGDASIDILVDYHVHRAGVRDSMSDEEIIKRIYDYLAKNWRYPYETKGMKKVNLNFSNAKIKAYQKKEDALKKAGKIRYDKKYAFSTGTGFTYNGLGEMETYTFSICVIIPALQTMIGVCDDNAAAMTLMCRHAGLTAGLAAGTVSKSPHTWSWVKVNGTRYFYDIGSAIHSYYRNHKVSYSFYKRTKSQMKKRYVFEKIW